MFVVKLFGTEDRPVAHPIPAKDDVYDFIIFRGGDIQELRVIGEQPPAPVVSSLPPDPAIVSVSGYLFELLVFCPYGLEE